MNSKISCKLALMLLISTLAAGCAFFRPSLQSQLLHYDMVFVEGGEFVMGDFYEKENDDSLPLHTVTLDDFYIGAFEVTYQQYDAFAAATGREKPRDDGRGRGNRAVVYVSWNGTMPLLSAMHTDIDCPQNGNGNMRHGRGAKTICIREPRTKTA